MQLILQDYLLTISSSSKKTKASHLSFSLDLLLQVEFLHFLTTEKRGCGCFASRTSQKQSQRRTKSLDNVKS